MVLGGIAPLSLLSRSTINFTHKIGKCIFLNLLLLRFVLTLTVIPVVSQVLHQNRSSKAPPDPLPKLLPKHPSPNRMLKICQTNYVMYKYVGVLHLTTTHRKLVTFISLFIHILLAIYLWYPTTVKFFRIKAAYC